jgi:ribosomal protein S27AE
MVKESLNCPGCGSTDMERNDGFWVCGHCGSKYSDEQYKKLELSGKVDVSGNIRIDDSHKHGIYLQNARRDVKSENWAGVVDYYTEVRNFDPNCLDALIFLPLGRLMQTQKDRDYSSRADIINVLCKSITNISELWTDSKQDHITVNTFAVKLERLKTTKFVQRGRNGNPEFVPLTQDFADIVMAFIEELLEISGSGDSAALDRLILRECNLLFDIKRAKFKTKTYNQIIADTHARIAENEPDYIIPKKTKRFSRKQVSAITNLIIWAVVILFFLFLFSPLGEQVLYGF